MFISPFEGRLAYDYNLGHRLLVPRHSYHCSRIAWCGFWRRMEALRVGNCRCFRIFVCHTFYIYSFIIDTNPSIVSFLPPATTIRRYQRQLLSTTCGELGSIYCSIISFANTRHEKEVQEIITSLIAIRSKLKRSVVLRQNVIYEVFQIWFSTGSGLRTTNS